MEYKKNIAENLQNYLQYKGHTFPCKDLVENFLKEEFTNENFIDATEHLSMKNLYNKFFRTTAIKFMAERIYFFHKPTYKNIGMNKEEIERALYKMPEVYKILQEKFLKENEDELFNDLFYKSLENNMFTLKDLLRIHRSFNMDITFFPNREGEVVLTLKKELGFSLLTLKIKGQVVQEKKIGLLPNLDMTFYLQKHRIGFAHNKDGQPYFYVW